MTITVVHYLNQFFGGIGGEDEADVPPTVKDGPVGPGTALEAAADGAIQVRRTIICGDNYFTQNEASALPTMLSWVGESRADVLVAGPAFGSGRYGLACGKICSAAQSELGVPAVTGLHEENPAVEQFRADVVIVPTRKNAAGMRQAVSQMASLAQRLGQGEELGPPSEDGYFARGVRRNVFAERKAAVRAVDLLVKKLGGQEYETEWPLPQYDRVDPPPPLDRAGPLRVALISEGAVVPKGNPDGIRSAWATSWGRYDISAVQDLTADDFETVHGGFDTKIANADPDRLIPVDAMRSLEREGALKLHEYLCSTAGNMGSVAEMRRIGAQMADFVKIDPGVHAVIVGAT